MLKTGVSVIAASAIVATLTTVGPSRALTMQECSAKYKAAQAAGSKLKWNDFRKAECGADAAATPAAAPVTVAPAATTAAPAKPAAKPAETKPSAATQAAAGSAVWPNSLSEQPLYGRLAGLQVWQTSIAALNRRPAFSRVHSLIIANR